MSRNALSDEILVVDLESTCWEIDPPPGEMSDIIEIGVAHLNRTDLSITKGWTTYVIPARSKISPYSEQLNRVTDEIIKMTGIPLEEAFKMLESVGSKHRTWASWGNYDRKKMEGDAKELNLRYPMSPRHINVKTLFAVLYDLPKEVGMSKALELMRLPLTGRHHSGKDDAQNIAKILSHLIRYFRKATIMTDPFAVSSASQNWVIDNE